MTRLRRALVVGIDSYAERGNDLAFAVADAQAIGELLAKHADGSPNYDCRVLSDVTENGDAITRPVLRQSVRQLFENFNGDVILYFAGHGVLTATGGYLCTYDSEADDWGVPMQEVFGMAADSSAQNVVVILDCCHSGDFADPSLIRGSVNPLALVRENMSVIAASHATQTSAEAGGHGMFTAAVLDALEGGAADHMGFVTAPSIYAYVERRFGAQDQRPIYKSHATEVAVIRECAPLIDRLKLRQMIDLFPSYDYRYQLDPEFEPEDEFGNLHEPVNDEKVAIAQLLKEYRDSGLLKPSTPGEQLFWAARNSHTVELTLRGQEYWRLAKNGRI